MTLTRPRDPSVAAAHPFPPFCSRKSDRTTQERRRERQDSLTIIAITMTDRVSRYTSLNRAVCQWPRVMLVTNWTWQVNQVNNCTYVYERKEVLCFFPMLSGSDNVKHMILTLKADKLIHSHFEYTHLCSISLKLWIKMNINVNTCNSGL